MEPYRFDPSKCCRQRRSHTPRRPSRRGFFTEFSSCKNNSVCTSAAGTAEASPRSLSGQEEEMGFYMARCDMVSAEPSISNSAEAEPSKAESIGRNASEYSTKGSFGQRSSGHASSLSPAKPKPSSLGIQTDGDALLAPGSIGWAKIATFSLWWPVEIMDGKRDLEFSNNQPDGLVLVQFFGSQKYAWVDPIKCLSQFDHCYEERSSNPSKEFQEALQQALQRKVLTTSSLQSDKFDISSSSKTSDNQIHGGRGKRKHKPRVHFDELVSPEKSIRKVRRMRIMRYLGLAAPVGSPFSQPHARNSC